MPLTEDDLMAGYRARRSTEEDDLLLAVTEAMQLTGWRWTHARRSDLAQLQGSQGVPDIIAARQGVGLALELKSAHGQPTPEQLLWLADLALVGLHALVIRPDDLDQLLTVITRGAAWQLALNTLAVKTAAAYPAIRL